MTGWFGESWGAPCCDPEDHVATPVGSKCLGCDNPIQEKDQGITMPFISLNREVTTCAYHLDCYLKKILPHGPDCKRCRGYQPHEHEEECAFRCRGEECSCARTIDRAAPADVDPAIWLKMIERLRRMKPIEEGVAVDDPDPFI